MARRADDGSRSLSNQRSVTTDPGPSSAAASHAGAHHDFSSIAADGAGRAELRHARRFGSALERMGWDSNPRELLTQHAFQACAFSRSATHPGSHWVRHLEAEREGFEPSRPFWGQTP